MLTHSPSLPSGEDQSLYMKQQLRKHIRSKLRALSSDEIRDQSKKVWKQLFELSEYHESKSVGLFLNMPKGEIDTSDACVRVLKDNKQMYVPRVGLQFEHNEMDLILVKQTLSTENIIRTIYEDWPKNKWNIPEPPDDDSHTRAQPGDIDILVVPGLGFDQFGGRLGQGKGYYDRFITKIQKEDKPLLIGVGLEPSWISDPKGLDIERIPMLEHDHHMNMFISPSTLIRFC